MEKNKINEITENPENEKTYEEHIIKTINKLKENKNIKISGKILHYLETPILYYYCTSISNTNSNPFDIDIEFRCDGSVDLRHFKPVSGQCKCQFKRIAVHGFTHGEHRVRILFLKQHLFMNIIISFWPMSI